MAEQNEQVVYEDPKDSWSAGKLVVLCVITLVVGFGVIDFISNIGLKMAKSSGF